VASVPASLVAHTSSQLTPSIALITWICTGGTPISTTFLPATMSDGVRAWKAKACASTITNSTLRALNNAQNSLKSGARSNELSPQEFNGRDTLGGCSAQPVLERAVGPLLLAETRHRQLPSIESKLHERILVERLGPPPPSNRPSNIEISVNLSIPRRAISEISQLGVLARALHETARPASQMICRGQRVALESVAGVVGDDEIVQRVVRVTRPGDKVVDLSAYRFRDWPTAVEAAVPLNLP
jgi:hypothetical protein